MLYHPILVLLTLVWFPCMTLTCKPLNWVHFSMERILSEADIVVYGKETERYLVDPSDVNGQQNARFLVYCVLKNDDIGAPISQNIIIERVYPVTSCSGTDVPPNKDVLLALRRTSSGNFLWDEVNPVPDGAVFPVSSDMKELTAAMRVCNLRNPEIPSGRNPGTQPTCPTAGPLEGGCTDHGERMKLSIWSILLILLVLFL